MAASKPTRKPTRPHFSSGPCPKRPGWDLAALPTDTLGRSHRSSLGKERLGRAIHESRELLGLPDSHLLGIVPASDTGAYEIAMWSLLGPLPVDCLVWESFSKGWATDVSTELKLDHRALKAEYGEIPDLAEVDWTHDVTFVWNGTTSGVRVPGADWIPDDRLGLALCDATSAAFAMELPWDKLDVVTYSWQKCLGGEGAHGVLILGPRAVERIESYDPPWPLPKILRLKKGDKLNRTIFEGSTINTPSMLCVEDYLDALAWARDIGGRAELIARSERNLAVVEKWVEQTPAFDFLAKDKTTRSCTSVCLNIVDPAFLGMLEDDRKARLKALVSRLEKEAVAYDIASYRDAPSGLRVWCGPTVEAEDVEILLEWVAWAYESA